MHYMTILKNKLSVIDDVVPHGSRIIYLDIPLHLNVGDLLIYKGTEQFFKERKYKVLARRTDNTSLAYVKKITDIPDDVIILLHGGGNFGDLYPQHQALREAVVEKFPNNKVIFLPQTVHFKNEIEMRKSASIIRAHKNLTIFCRDTRSHNILHDNFCNDVRLCPDMAHSLWGIYSTQKKEDIKRDTLWMIRKDIEETNLVGLEGIPGPSHYEDWEDICSDKDRSYTNLLRQFERINNLIGKQIVPTELLWSRYTDRLVERVNNYFKIHSDVVTSRMHGHILCCLLGVNTKLLDNSYGKNSTYYEAWTKSVPNCELINI